MSDDPQLSFDLPQARWEKFIATIKRAGFLSIEDAIDSIKTLQQAPDAAYTQDLKKKVSRIMEKLGAPHHLSYHGRLSLEQRAEWMRWKISLHNKIAEARKKLERLSPDELACLQRLVNRGTIDESQFD